MTSINHAFVKFNSLEANFSKTSSNELCEKVANIDVENCTKVIAANILVWCNDTPTKLNRFFIRDNFIKISSKALQFKDEQAISTIKHWLPILRNFRSLWIDLCTHALFVQAFENCQKEFANKPSQTQPQANCEGSSKTDQCNDSASEGDPESSPKIKNRSLKKVSFCEKNNLAQIASKIRGFLAQLKDPNNAEANVIMAEVAYSAYILYEKFDSITGTQEDDNPNRKIYLNLAGEINRAFARAKLNHFDSQEEEFINKIKDDNSGEYLISVLNNDSSLQSFKRIFCKLLLHGLIFKKPDALAKAKVIRGQLESENVKIALPFQELLNSKSFKRMWNHLIKETSCKLK